MVLMADWIPKSEAKLNKIRADEKLFDLSSKRFSSRSLNALCAATRSGIQVGEVLQLHVFAEKTDWVPFSRNIAKNTNKETGLCLGRTWWSRKNFLMIGITKICLKFYGKNPRDQSLFHNSSRKKWKNPKEKTLRGTAKWQEVREN